MTLTLSNALLQRLEEELCRSLTQFGESPSRTGLFEVAAVAELVGLDSGSFHADSLSTLLRSHVALWCEWGLLEDLLFTEPSYAYHTALLMAFAPSQYRDDLRPLWTNGLLGRTEWPILQQIMITSALAPWESQEVSALLKSVPRWFALGPRTLRSNADDFDISALLQLAQVLNLRVPEVVEFRRSQNGCQKLCRELLALTLRTGDLNRMPVLGYLGARFFDMARSLLSTVKETLESRLASWNSFTSIQDHLHTVSDDLGLTQRALVLRSATAWALLLTTP
jgi:hypothetical protein